MPRIERSRASLLDSSYVRFVGATLGIAGLLSLGALFVGFSDTGAIDVNGRISATDQSGFATKVNTAAPTNLANGGLQPASQDPDAPVAPEAPASLPEVGGASTTSTTTEESAEAEQHGENTESSEQSSE